MDRMKAPNEAGWDLREYPGDEDCPAFAVEVRRQRIQDRDWMVRYEADLGRRMADESVSDAERHDWQWRTESEAMALRLRDEDGETWTADRVEALGGISPDAWRWLSDQCFPWMRPEVSSGKRQQKLGRRSAALEEIAELQERLWSLRSDLVRTA